MAPATPARLAPALLEAAHDASHWRCHSASFTASSPLMNTLDHRAALDVTMGASGGVTVTGATTATVAVAVAVDTTDAAWAMDGGAIEADADVDADADADGAVTATETGCFAKLGIPLVRNHVFSGDTVDNTGAALDAGALPGRMPKRPTGRGGGSCGFTTGKRMSLVTGGDTAYTTGCGVDTDGVDTDGVDTDGMDTDGVGVGTDGVDTRAGGMAEAVTGEGAGWGESLRGDGGTVEVAPWGVGWTTA